MKNSTFSLSPFLFLILPVLLFMGISFGLQKNFEDNNNEITNYNSSISRNLVINSSAKSFFKLLQK
jgi:hypothetical protein